MIKSVKKDDLKGVIKLNEAFEITITDLSNNYGIKLDRLKYLKFKKNYSDTQLKKTVFEKKYGKGCAATNYFNYFLPRILNKKNDFVSLKKEFFTDFKLSNKLSRLLIEKIWEDLMIYRLKL